MRDWLAQRLRGGINRLGALLHLPLGPLRRLRQNAWRGARSCNLAVWRSDLDRVDGFDADYRGWGKEDSDIIVRLQRAGVRRKDGVFATGVLHLWHAEADRSALPANEQKALRHHRQRRNSRATRSVRPAARGARGRKRGVGRDAIERTLSRIADGLVVAVAVSLPWSTSATGILLVLWLLALIPTLDWPSVRRELMTPAGGLPVLLVLLGVLGMAWADVSLIERWKGLNSFFKLLAIPLLMAQFRRSGRGAGRVRRFSGRLRRAFDRFGDRQDLAGRFPTDRGLRRRGEKLHRRRAPNLSSASAVLLYLAVEAVARAALAVVGRLGWR